MLVGQMLWHDKSLLDRIQWPLQLPIPRILRLCCSILQVVREEGLHEQGQWPAPGFSWTQK